MNQPRQQQQHNQNQGQQHRRRRNNNNRNRSGNFRHRNNNNNNSMQAILNTIDYTIPEDKKIILGVTGEPGSGKSAFVKEFMKLNAEVIDVDNVGHDVIDGTATQKKLVATFGEDILGEDKKIIRETLAAKAFVDAETVAVLNKIVHPMLKRKVNALLKKTSNFVIIDAALLNELGLGEACNSTIYVRSPREARLERVARRGWDEAELSRRENALGVAEERAAACGLIVENTGSYSLLQTYAKTILARQLGVDPVALKKQQAAAEHKTETAEGQASEATESNDSTQQKVLTPEVNEDIKPPPREPVEIKLSDYLARKLPDLQEEADKLEVRDARFLGRNELICELVRRAAGERNDSIIVEGYIEFHKEHSAYIRSPSNNYAATATDTFISAQQIRRYGIKAGMHIVGKARAPRGNERCPQLLSVESIMGEAMDERSRFPRFQDLVPLHAEDRLFMERSDQPYDYSLRIIDLISPIGKGQRGLIVAQPKCGKTVYLQKIANAITTNNPDVTLMVLLIDERPEEVTDMQREVNGEVIASTFDQRSSRHVQIAEMAINKAKRLVERGDDVVILLDSITRLARAYNSEAPSSGRIMSGGLESGALIRPKQFFGAARNIENGGSLTILATALVDTGSVMDTVIFEEFKGTGNMEIVLDRRLSNKGIYPAVDVAQSSTRKDHLLIGNDEEIKRLQALRRFLSDRSPQDAVEFLKKQLKGHKTNIEFLMSIDPERGSFM